MTSKEITTMRSILATAVSLVALALGAGTAQATITIESFSSELSETTAGGHPDITTSFTLADPGSPEAAKNVIINTPEGLFGNPQAATECTSTDFALQSCPPNSQAGLITIYANHEGNPSNLLGTAPLFVVVPEDEDTARFAFIVPTLNIPIVVPVAVRTGSDYGLRFTVSEITQVAPLARADILFWGFPANKAHDADRFPKGAPGAPAGCPGATDTACAPSTAASIPSRPLTVNPTICTGQELPVTIDVQSYQDPGELARAETTYDPITECPKQTFDPVLEGTTTTSESDSASGMDLELKIPQFLGDAVAPARIRSAVVTFPPGLTINPDAADGQTACSDADANFGTEGPAQCPDNAKIGTFAMTSPALDGPLNGSLYFGQPKPNDQYRMFMVADGFGIHAKLESSIRPDPQTGQVTAVFGNLPQVPFDAFSVHLFASDRGLVATPTHCGVYPLVARFVPWNASLPTQNSTQFFSIDSGPGGSPCPGELRPFEPRLVAGTSNANAGAFSDFTLRLDRDDGDQFLGDLNFRMPPGFTGSLRGISYCPEAAIAAAANNAGRAERGAPSCPASASIGTTNVAAGPGGHPFHAAGRIYMAGPLKGAPLSLVAVTPALAGPYDYGVVVVRVALHVDPLTAQVSAISDRVPQIIGGVPIRMRSIEVNLDRPNFTINPTNCSAFSIDSEGIGDQGAVARFGSYFNAVNCGTLGFRPRMTVKQLGKRRDTRRSRNPRLRFELRTRPGDANIRSVAVTLPKAFAIDQRHLGNICSRAQLEAESCAGRQPIGSVETRTPLLDQPLKGPAYAVSGFGKLPRLAFILDGQVRLVPQAESRSVKGGFLRTTVPTVPDAPIGYFRLDLLGGKQGYITNTRNLCNSPARVSVHFTAQSGATRAQKVRTKTACGATRKSRRAKRAGR